MRGLSLSNLLRIDSAFAEMTRRPFWRMSSDCIQSNALETAICIKPGSRLPARFTVAGASIHYPLFCFSESFGCFPRSLPIGSLGLSTDVPNASMTPLTYSFGSSGNGGNSGSNGTTAAPKIARPTLSVGMYRANLRIAPICGCCRGFSRCCATPR